MSESKNTCPVCSSVYVLLNAETAEYSGIEVSIFPYMHLIRVRKGYYDPTAEGAQDIVEINYCPICGRKLEGGKA